MILSKYSTYYDKRFPFQLAYGTNALTLMEIGSHSLQIGQFKELYNDKWLRLNLYLLDEVQDAAVLKLAIYQQKTTRHYNQKIKQKRFTIGDLGLREVEPSTPQNVRKLMPNWEGLYEVIEVPKPRTYRLQTIERVELKNTWHEGCLWKYYQ